MLRAIILIAALAPAAAAQQPQPHPVTRSQFISTTSAAFGEMDTNHDGYLSAAELQAAQGKALQEVQAALRARIQAQFKALDTNKDGQLSLAEFSAAIPSVKTNETAEQILQKLDTNHDGKVSPEEFRAPRLAQFDKADLNHDGTVTPDEERRARGGK